MGMMGAAASRGLGSLLDDVGALLGDGESLGRRLAVRPSFHPRALEGRGGRERGGAGRRGALGRVRACVGAWHAAPLAEGACPASPAAASGVRGGLGMAPVLLLKAGCSAACSGPGHPARNSVVCGHGKRHSSQRLCVCPPACLTHTTPQHSAASPLVSPCLRVPIPHLARHRPAPARRPHRPTPCSNPHPPPGPALENCSAGTAATPPRGGSLAAGPAAPTSLGPAATAARGARAPGEPSCWMMTGLAMTMVAIMMMMTSPPPSSPGTVAASRARPRRQ